MRAVVTGATGCVGRVLCRELTVRGWGVRALVRLGREHGHLAGSVAEIFTGDILDPESLDGLAEGADVVFHLAARVTDHGSRSLFHSTIVGGTRNMLRASAGRAGRFVQVSSTTACGVGRHLRDRKEEDPCFRSGVPYSDAKLEAEALVDSYGSRFPEGFAIVRPSNVLGPGSPYVDEVCRRLLSPLGVPLIDGGRHDASLVYVDNLADAVILAGTRPLAPGRIYHVCDDWQVSWKRYLTDLSALLGKAPRGTIPFRAAWFMGHVLERVCAPLGLRPPVTRLAAHIMGRDNHVDTARARTELGWRTRVSYTEAMRQIGGYVQTLRTGLPVTRGG